ncbi:thiamine pyrophosphate-dependent dehydrogenase E1 component subunit alpha [Vagococcus humatus]|uniref:2-oxoisovalerate dehydrogenase subunit alpha n=1 Tax=Vagococcus humatus TaxID=1889241 RepID=A0A429Z5D4_9ENTE|nr:thiamine pyrophosphate-dependent dehydrogenase E1 component subunit alpha [Vagococcus humatus]RST88890.1 2-oxoisovalerate dehydrogenase [Vagococcus humatus]
MEKLKATGLSKKEIVEAYRMIKLGRVLDERLWQLTRIGKSSFIISGQGSEVGQVAMALPFQHKEDMFLPYYRDMVASMIWGMSTKDILLGSLGKQEDPSSHGRQMPNHYGSVEHNIVSFGSTVTTQYPLATGVAYSAILNEKDYVTLVTTGEGSAAEGDFHEALNFAGIKKLPIVFVVENNEYAISTPVEDEFSGKKLADHALAYHIKGDRIDGRDFAATYLAFKEAADYARSGKGPVLIELMVDRMTAHSSDDDQSIYRSDDELKALRDNDVIPVFEKQLIEEGYLTEKELDDILKEVTDEVNQATDEAEQSPDPDVSELYKHVYAHTEGGR